MNYQDIQPFEISGFWQIPPDLYFQAKRNFERADKLAEDYLGTEGYVIEITPPEEDASNIEITSLCISCQIFCCMTIEAFLNRYGIQRLGMVFFRNYLQYKRIHEKLALIIAICEGKLIDKDNELVRLIADMFDRRNSLVHPKSKEVDDASELKRIYYLKDAKESIKGLESFFKLFIQIDPNVNQYGTYLKIVK